MSTQISKTEILSTKIIEDSNDSEKNNLSALQKSSSSQSIGESETPSPGNTNMINGIGVDSVVLTGKLSNVNNDNTATGSNIIYVSALPATNNNDSFPPLKKAMAGIMIFFGFVVAASLALTTLVGDSKSSSESSGAEKGLIDLIYDVSSVFLINMLLNAFSYFHVGADTYDYIKDFPKKFRGIDTDDIPQCLQSRKLANSTVSFDEYSKCDKAKYYIYGSVFHPITKTVVLDGAKVAACTINMFAQYSMTNIGGKGIANLDARDAFDAISLLGSLIIRIYSMNKLPDNIYRSLLYPLSKTLRDYRAMSTAMNKAKPYLVSDLKKLSENNLSYNAQQAINSLANSNNGINSTSTNGDSRSNTNSDSSSIDYIRTLNADDFDDAKQAFKKEIQKATGQAKLTLLIKLECAYLARWGKVNASGNFDAESQFSTNAIDPREFNDKNKQQFFEDTLLLTAAKAKVMKLNVNNCWTGVLSTITIIATLAITAYSVDGGFSPYYASGMEDAFANLSGWLVPTLSAISASVSAALYALGPILLASTLENMIPAFIYNYDNWWRQEMTIGDRIKGLLSRFAALPAALAPTMVLLLGSGEAMRVTAANYSLTDNPASMQAARIGAILSNTVGVTGLANILLNRIKPVPVAQLPQTASSQLTQAVKNRSKEENKSVAKAIKFYDECTGKPADVNADEKSPLNASYNTSPQSNYGSNNNSDSNNNNNNSTPEVTSIHVDSINNDHEDEEQNNGVCCFC